MDPTPTVKGRNSLKNTSPLALAGAGFALFWEQLWPLLVPVFMVVMVFFGLSWLGLWQYLPLWAHIGLLAFIIIAGLLALTPLSTFTLPSRAQIFRRIELETKLSDRPISAQADEMALGDNDAFSRALWGEHQIRMNKRLQHLTGGAPRPDGNRFDPWGLRLLLPILIFIAFMTSYGAGGGKIRDAFTFTPDPQTLLARLDVWINPPPYTNKAPIYLSQGGKHQIDQSIIIPQNSQLTGRFVGNGNISLRFHNGETQTDIAPQTPDENSTSPEREQIYKLALQQSGIVRIYSGNTAIAQWSLKVVADKVPTIRFEQEPTSSLSGALQLAYSLSDDHGVIKATGLIEPAHQSQTNGVFDKEFPARFIPPANARALIKPLEIKLPLPRRRTRSGKAKVNRDVSKHPLAGSMVNLTLIATDDAGQSGRSETKQLTLPGRRFSDPVANALIEQRRILALDANQQTRVIGMLDAISTAPQFFIEDYTTHLAIKVAYRRLVNARTDDHLRDVMDLMWDIALGIEYGKMSNAERRLREAQERLSEALENGASDEEIDKLMKELRQAMNELMQALKEQALNNPQNQNPLLQDEAARTLRQKDLQNMLDRIEDLAKSGSKDAARELLSQMQRMMDNLRAGRHMQQRRAEGNETNKALDNLSDLLQKQQQLMDETFSMEQQRPQNNENTRPDQNQQGQRQNENRQGQQDKNNGEDQEMSAQEYADALSKLNERQRALQKQLNSLNQQLQELGLAPTGEFDEAGKQMGKAGEQLGQGEAGKAAGNQGKALDALKRGVQSMMQQMAGDRQQGGRQPGNSRSEQNARDMRDPLGRNNNPGGENSLENFTPGEIDAQKARRILEAIRKRLSEPKARALEKNYLERLLNNR